MSRTVKILDLNDLSFDHFKFVSYLLTNVAPPGAWVADRGSPTISVPHFPLQLFPSAIHSFDDWLRFSAQCVHRTTSYPLAFRISSFCSVYSTQLQRLFLISSSSGIWFVLRHSRLLLMTFSQQILSNYACSPFRLTTDLKPG